MTKSAEDYIEAIYVLIEETRRARVRDVAAHLNVKMPSVVKAVSELKKEELVTQEPYGDIALTEKGRRCALFVLSRHRVLKAFLEKLGVSSKTADKDACLMEHILSAETMERIRDFISSKSRARKSAAREAVLKTTKKESTCPKTK